MPATTPNIRTLGATYLAALITGNANLIDQIRQDYPPDQLLRGLETQAIALALRAAGQEQTSTEEVSDRLVAAAVLRDKTEAL